MCESHVKVQGYQYLSLHPAISTSSCCALKADQPEWRKNEQAAIFRPRWQVDRTRTRLYIELRGSSVCRDWLYVMEKPRVMAFDPSYASRIYQSRRRNTSVGVSITASVTEGLWEADWADAAWIIEQMGSFCEENVMASCRISPCS